MSVGSKKRGVKSRKGRHGGEMEQQHGVWAGVRAWVMLGGWVLLTTQRIELIRRASHWKGDQYSEWLS